MIRSRLRTYVRLMEPILSNACSRSRGEDRTYVCIPCHLVLASGSVWGGSDMAETDDLTPRQRRILQFIADTVLDRGYPPTVREIGEAVGLTSSSSVHSQLANLERRGLLRKDPTKPPAIGLSGPGADHDRGVQVPLLGRIAAGAPMLAEENVEEYLSVPSGFASDDD